MFEKTKMNEKVAGDGPFKNAFYQRYLFAIDVRRGWWLQQPEVALGLAKIN